MAICAISASATHLARLHGFRGMEPAELSVFPVFPVFPAVVFGSVSGVMAAPPRRRHCRSAKHDLYQKSIFV
jgi:hypothetical protein